MRLIKRGIDKTASPQFREIRWVVINLDAAIKYGPMKCVPAFGNEPAWSHEVDICCFQFGGTAA